MASREPTADEPGSMRRRRRGRAEDLEVERGRQMERERGGGGWRRRGEGEIVHDTGGGGGKERLGCSTLRLFDGEGRCILQRVLLTRLEALQLPPMPQFADAAAFGEVTGVSLTTPTSMRE
jgi:hypothetical protein